MNPYRDTQIDYVYEYHPNLFSQKSFNKYQFDYIEKHRIAYGFITLIYFIFGLFTATTFVTLILWEIALLIIIATYINDLRKDTKRKATNAAIAIEFEALKIRI